MPQDPTVPSDKPLPEWAMPDDLDDILADDGEWEDPSWDPLLLSVIGDTRHEGRLIKVVWQLSLWPSDPFFAPLNKALSARGTKPDGHGWAETIGAEIANRNPALAERLNDDSEAETCVIWVESEADGRALMEAAWTYVYGLTAGKA